MYIFSEVGKVTTFGPEGDIKPVSVAIFDNHMTVRRDGGSLLCSNFVCLFCSSLTLDPCTTLAEALVLIGGDGMTFVNGDSVKKDQEVPLTPGSRVVIGNDLMLYEWKDKMPDEVMSVDDAISEYHTALNKLMSGGGGSTVGPLLLALRLLALLLFIILLHRQEVRASRNVH